MESCKHGGCKCQVEAGQEYCSDYCKEHGDHGHEHACDCGHPDCSA